MHHDGSASDLLDMENSLESLEPASPASSVLRHSSSAGARIGDVWGEGTS